MTLPLFRPSLEAIPYSKDFVFQALDWYAEDSDGIELDTDDRNAPKRKYVITCFGVTSEGQTVSIDITGYNPHFYIKIPAQWKKDDAAKFVRNIKESFAADRLQKWGNARSNPVGDALKKFELIRRKTLMGFDGGKDYPFMRLFFYNISGMRAWVRKIQEQHDSDSDSDSDSNSDLEIYESNIDPLLRFMHILNLKPLGWIRISAGKFDRPEFHDRLSQAYLVVDESAIKPFDNEKIAPFLIASYDIEADSVTGDFPMAKRGSKIRKIMLDVVAAAKTCGKMKGNSERRISELSQNIKSILNFYSAENNSAFTRLESSGIFQQLELSIMTDSTAGVSELFLADEDSNAKTPRKSVKELEESIFEILNTSLPHVQGDRVIQIGTTFHRFGDPSYSFKHVITLDTCSPIEGVFVHTCKTEKELLLAWKDLMAKADPDIIIGKQLS